jgi:hypothetical protein
LEQRFRPHQSRVNPANRLCNSIIVPLLGLVERPLDILFCNILLHHSRKIIFFNHFRPKFSKLHKPECIRYSLCVLFFFYQQNLLFLDRLIIDHFVLCDRSYSVRASSLSHNRASALALYPIRNEVFRSCRNLGSLNLEPILSHLNIICVRHNDF